MKKKQIVKINKLVKKIDKAKPKNKPNIAKQFEEEENIGNFNLLKETTKFLEKNSKKITPIEAKRISKIALSITEKPKKTKAKSIQGEVAKQNKEKSKKKVLLKEKKKKKPRKVTETLVENAMNWAVERTFSKMLNEGNIASMYFNGKRISLKDFDEAELTLGENLSDFVNDIRADSNLSESDIVFIVSYNPVTQTMFVDYAGFFTDEFDDQVEI
jgi:hypothetical protein